MGDIKEETQSKTKEVTKCKICSSEAVPELYGYCEYCYKNVA